jgi:TATA-box binding protein (TBP) (component of TFIID and TFIIIB)
MVDDESVQSTLARDLPQLHAALKRISPTPLRVNTMTLAFSTDLPPRSVVDMQRDYAAQLPPPPPDGGIPTRRPFKNCVILRRPAAEGGGATVVTKVFCNGVLHVTGACDLKTARDTALACVGPTVTIMSHTVQLLTAVFDLGCAINLSRFCELLRASGRFDVSFNREKYSGLIVRVKGNSVAIIFFGSGKGMVTGAKAPEPLTSAYSAVLLFLDAHADECLHVRSSEDPSAPPTKRRRGRRPKALVASMYAELLGDM